MKQIYLLNIWAGFLFEIVSSTASSTRPELGAVVVGGPIDFEASSLHGSEVAPDADGYSAAENSVEGSDAYTSLPNHILAHTIKSHPATALLGRADKSHLNELAGSSRTPEFNLYSPYRKSISKTCGVGTTNQILSKLVRRADDVLYLDAIEPEPYMQNPASRNSILRFGEYLQTVHSVPIRVQATYRGIEHDAERISPWLYETGKCSISVSLTIIGPDADMSLFKGSTPMTAVVSELGFYTSGEDLNRKHVDNLYQMLSTTTQVKSIAIMMHYDKITAIVLAVLKVNHSIESFKLISPSNTNLSLNHLRQIEDLLIQTNGKRFKVLDILIDKPTEEQCNVVEKIASRHGKKGDYTASTLEACWNNRKFTLLQGIIEVHKADNSRSKDLRVIAIDANLLVTGSCVPLEIFLQFSGANPSTTGRQNQGEEGQFLNMSASCGNT